MPSIAFIHKIIIKYQWKGLLITKHLYQAIEHTCMLRIAKKLIILKITKASECSKTIAYQNKYSAK
jgi:hypothetical protein